MREERDVERDSRIVCAIIIGTEILKGFIQDRNLYWIARELTKHGYILHKAIFIPDDERMILEELDKCVGNYDIIIVCGGLGPTDDDVTREAVAKALNRKLILSEDICKQLMSKYGSEKDIEKRIKMCYIPEGAKILNNRIGVAPGFYVEEKGSQIFVLPGVPKEAEEMFLSEVTRFIDRKLESNLYCEKTLVVMGLREKDLSEVVKNVLDQEGLLDNTYFKTLIADDYLILKFLVKLELVDALNIAIKKIIEFLKKTWPHIDVKTMD